MPINQNQPAAGDCGPEDVLDLSGCPIDYAEANSRLASFKERFRNADEPAKDMSHMEALLYAHVETFVNSFASPTAPCTGSYFRGLVISYGMKDGKMINIYQAALMNAITPDGSEYRITAGPATIYTGKFEADPAIATYIEAYKRLTEIKRKPGDDVYKPFTDHSGSTADDNATSILYPLQEITAVWEQNGKADAIYFHTAAALDLKSSGRDIYKQEILIGARSTFPAGLGGAAFVNHAGNLGHLCPPRCATVFATRQA